MPPQPVPAKDIKEIISKDVVVVGAGTAGIAAALSALQMGAKAVLIEKHTTFRWGGGHNSAIGSRLQKQLGIEIDKDEVVRQLMKFGGNRSDQRLIRLWADHSGAVIDWVCEITDAAGIKIAMHQWPRPKGVDLTKETYPEFPTCHYWKGQLDIKNMADVMRENVERSGSGLNWNQGVMLQCLLDNFLKCGGDLRYRTRAMQLIRQGKGRVAGVIAQNEDGDFIQFNTRRGVVLTTGDFGNNPEMMQKYCPAAAEAAADKTKNIYMLWTKDLREAKEPLNVGDGHKMALWAGGVMEPGPHAPMMHAIGLLGIDPFLHVNTKGERFENEDVPSEWIVNALLCQPGGIAWQIFDSSWEQDVPRMGAGLYRIFEVTDATRLTVEARAMKANTIEELASKIKVPAQTLKETVRRYNELAKNGKDFDFGKRADRLTAIEKPPFFAGKISFTFGVVCGGLIVNAKLQPLDAESNVIHGLYLAGNTVGRFFTVDYPTMCPGLSHGMCLTLGRLAGLNAAASEP